MRKAILLAAALASGAAALFISGPVKAETPDFDIKTTGPGILTFSGSGTAQFNNSTGTNNSFQVGSATSLGVNASTSSTPEYGVDSTAILALDSQSNMSQTIGTSGAGSSQVATSTRAHDATRSSMYSRGWEAGWSANVEYENSSGTKVTYDTQAQWDVAYNTEYNSTYQNKHTEIEETQSTSTSDGTISGSFRTIEYNANSNNSITSGWETSASASADSKWGSSYDANNTYGHSNETEWKAAWDTEYNSEYARSSAGASKFSDSQVTVKGIGSDANIVAAGTSSFTTDITALDDAMGFSSTATAQGSAGASLSTVSLANQSQSQTASAFIQSFGGDDGGGSVADTTTTTGTYTTTAVTQMTPDSPATPAADPADP